MFFGSLTDITAKLRKTQKFPSNYLGSNISKLEVSTLGELSVFWKIKLNIFLLMFSKSSSDSLHNFPTSILLTRNVPAVKYQLHK